MRADLKTSEIPGEDGGWTVVKDPVRLKYHQLRNEQRSVLELLDGRRSLEAIRSAMRQRHRTGSFTASQLQHLIGDLHEKGLAIPLRGGEAERLLEREKERQRRRRKEMLANVLSLRLPGWDPDRCLARLDPLAEPLFRPWGFVAMTCLIVVAWLLLLSRFEEFRQSVPAFREFFGAENLVWLWVTLAGAKVIHEFGHGLACKRFGGECHAMGVMLLVFSPCLYCDVTDSWMLQDKRRRMIIAAAGVYFELILSALAIFVWHGTGPGWAHHLAMNVVFVTAVTTLVFNANPLMRLDGYYVLADAIETPNLRQKASQVLQEEFAWRCLGIRLPADPFPPRLGRRWLLVYAVASASYRVVVTFSVCGFLCSILRPYGIQSLGILLAAFAGLGYAAGLATAIVKILRAPRSEPMCRGKVVMSLVSVLGTVAGLMLIPVSLPGTAPFELQPRQVRHVHSPHEGVLKQVLARPGDQVRQGQLLAVLDSDALHDEWEQWKALKGQAEASVTTALNRGDRAQRHLAEARIQTLDERGADIQRRMAVLEIRAPSDGVVIAPPQRPRGASDKDRRLQEWDGLPLERNNLGCRIAAQTHLLSIANLEELEAVVVLDQADRDEVQEGSSMRLWFQQSPGVTAEGNVRTIALMVLRRDSGPSNAGNRERSTEGEPKPHSSGITQARVAFLPPSNRLTPGAGGQARFPRQARTVAQWVWRSIRWAWHPDLPT